jgi:ligand-binding sensor domain-containing protein/putative methionine-R-sulfoxide reductase with GAF domain/anti-sigma regulatory factor (Ser/Thr protein kinase)
MWIGTQTGLQRYDGKRFVTYLADVHDENALQSDWINTVFEDSKQRLWVGTSVAGACLFNRNTGKFYNFNLHIFKGGKKINGIWQFLEDKQGNIWLSAYDGYYKFDERLQQFSSVNELLKMGSNELPASIAMDKEGDLWFATSKGVKKWVNKKAVLYNKINNPQHLALFDIKDPVSSIAFDDKGFIWLGTGFSRGLYRYSISGNAIKAYFFNKPHENQSRNLPEQNEYLGGLFLSTTGQLMLPLLSRGIAIYNYSRDSFSIINSANTSLYGLHMQVNIFNPEQADFLTYGLPANTMDNESPASEVSDFLQTNDGDIYVSYYFVNGGISRFDKNLHFKKHFLWKSTIDYKGEDNQIWGLFKDKEGIIWAPNQSGNILQLNPVTNQLTQFKDSLLKGNINQMQQDADGNIWLAHYRKGLVKMEAGTKRIIHYTNFYNPELSGKRRVQCFLLDKDKIWVGTIENGLQLFDKKSGSFITAFMLDSKNKQSISNNTITGIVAFNDDTLLIATFGGINIFNKKTNIFSSIQSKDGLPNNLAQAITLDEHKNLWAAFAGGLSKINLQNLRITNYGENDGIIDNRFNHSFFKLKDGRLMIGAAKSFLIFNPDKIQGAKIPPDVTITGFNVFGKQLLVDTLVNSTSPVFLNYQDNSFHIEFASLQYSDASNIHYYYQLQGVDKNWVKADGEHSVHYNQLPAGNFIFKIKAVNREGVLSKNITSLYIHIIPPFWKRWWFIGAICLLLGIGLFSIVKWREKNYKTIESGKTKLQQLTAEKYKAQFESEQISSFFTTSLMNKNDVDDVLWDVAKNLIGKLGFVVCMIYLWNNDKTKMIQKAGYGPKGSLEDLEKKLFDVMPGQGVVGAVIQSGEAILIPDTTIDQRYRVDDHKRMSELCVPIKYNEQLIGVIDSEHHEKNFYTGQHLQSLTTIATLVASKIKSIESDQRLRQQKAQLADVNDQLAEVQLAALRGQMNPHFIFNALNSIKKFVIANEPANAEKYLGKFSKLIRSILDNSRSGMVTVEKELQLLKLYLDLEQLRFGTKLTYSITMDENIQPGDIEIPSMIIQPFVENAMLHGIMHREDGGKVDINFILHKDWLEIIIEDNGVGREKSAAYKSENAEPHHSIGIQVATKRLEALKKNEDTPAGINIIDVRDESGDGCGTKVIISIPIY